MYIFLFPFTFVSISLYFNWVSCSTRKLGLLYYPLWQFLSFNCCTQTIHFKMIIYIVELIFTMFYNCFLFFAIVSFHFVLSSTLFLSSLVITEHFIWFPFLYFLSILIMSFEKNLVISLVFAMYIYN